MLKNLLDACGDDETIKRLVLTQEDLKGRLPKELIEQETPEEKPEAGEEED